MSETKDTLKVILLWLLIGCLIVGVVVVSYQVVYPWYLSVQRKAVEQSKSFTDANNNMLESYILESSRLDTKIAEAGDNTALVSAYKAQQSAIVGKMCREIATMATGTVKPSTMSWLASQGGCQ